MNRETCRILIGWAQYFSALCKNTIWLVRLCMHELTWLEKLDRTVVLMHCSMSASANIIAGFFPPSSSESLLQYGALRSVISLAVAVLPVNEINGTSGWDTSASPARGPVPKTMLITPGGKPRKSTHGLYRNITSIRMSSKVNAGKMHSY